MTTLTLAPLAPPEAPTVSSYRVNPARSRAEFSIGKRFFFVIPLTVVGRLDEVSETIVFDERTPENSRAELRLAAASISTGNARRDAHLRSADLFDMTRFPDISFVSRTIAPVDGAVGSSRATGDLTIRGVTLSVTLDVQMEPSSGAPRFAATTTLNRRHFGLHWQHPLVVPGDEVQIRVEIETESIP